MDTNLFDFIENLMPPDGGPSPWTARAPRRPQPDYDLKLVPRAPTWRDDSNSLAALDVLEAQPWVDVILRRADELRVRLRDEWIEAVGANLEAGGGAEGGLADLAAGRRYYVQFWDANATKALHVGHLRNLAIGNALAAALEQAGARVERRSLISDAGRSMGEAMAGVLRSGATYDQRTQGEQKSDHFVGVCYADYVGAASVGSDEDEVEDSLSRELEVQGDEADRLLKQVLAGDPDALELWFKTRAWVIAGQRKTLARLGVAFDRVFFESDFLQDAAALTSRGLELGLLERLEDGSVIYRSGLEDLSEVPLVRVDGVPTQHMRAISYWMSAPDMEHVTTLQVCGTEWVSHAACIRKLMTALTPSDNGGVHPVRDIFHGMVARQKRSITSSAEGALLIDDVIEYLEDEIDGDARMREVKRAHPAPERIPAQIALGYFLPHPSTPRIEFEPERMLREGQSMGWDVTRAQSTAGASQAAGQRPAEDCDYRFGVVQSQLYRRYLRLAVQQLDVRPIAHYLKHLSLWYLERERSGHVERVVETLMDRACRGLGLEAGR
jgi:arginyl-tRNA synthetase